MEQTTEQTIETRGGKRSNAGRKPSGVKKEPIFFYVESTLVEKVGKKELRNNIYKHLKTLQNDTGETI